jgi:hypothetical protein
MAMPKKKEHNPDEELNDILEIDESDHPVHEKFVHERKLKKIRDFKEF